MSNSKNRQHDSFWSTPPGSYPLSPQSWTERTAGLLRRYGFPVVLGLALVALLGALLWLVPQTGSGAGAAASVLDAVGASLRPEGFERGARSGARSGAGSAGMAGGEEEGLSPYAGQAELSVESEPSGALVVMGEDTLGRTPLGRRAVRAGAHLVSLQRAGHVSVDSVIILRNDRPTTLYARLTPLEDSEAPLRATYNPPAPQRERQPSKPPPTSQATSQPENRSKPSEARPAARQPTPDTQAAADSSALRYEKALRHGNELFVEERYEEALLAYAEALKVRPDDERAEERLEKTRARLKEEKRRAEQYQYHRARGDVLFEQGHYREAAFDYEQALVYRPGDAYVRERLRESRQHAEESDRVVERQAAELPVQEPAITEPPETKSPPEADEERAAARMNLNTATAAQLQRLPGIGPVLSQRILEYRTAHGPFRRVGDLERVRGIGPKTMANLRPLLFVEAP